MILDFKILSLRFLSSIDDVIALHMQIIYF